VLRDTDVVVVGGGPAGLAAAIAARAKGFRVTVVDRAAPPIDKACGEGLMPDGVAALEELGVPLGRQHGWPFTGLRFVASELAVEAGFPAQCGMGIRRLILHGLLVERAAEAGVAMHWSTEVSGLSPEGVLAGGRLIRARWIIGADGLNSRCRSWTGLGVSRTDRRFGFRRHFRVAPWTEFIEVYWSGCCQAYVTAVGPDEVCVALMSRDSAIRFESLFRLFPELGARLEHATAAEVRGGISATMVLPKVTRGSVALVGEASGSVDALTGAGLTLGFRQAIALADALAHGDLSPYQEAHTRIRSLPCFVGRSLLLMERSPWLRRRVMRAFARKPARFSSAVAFHTGSASSAAPGIGGTLSLGWKFMRA
jgi:menaquinone-9 beta-reductase